MSARVLLIPLVLLAFAASAVAAAEARAAQGTWRGTITIDASGSGLLHGDASMGTLERSAHATLLVSGARGSDGASGSLLRFEQRGVRVADDYRYDATWTDPNASRSVFPWNDCTSVNRLRSRGPVSGAISVSLQVVRQAGALAFGWSRIDSPRSPQPQVTAAYDDPLCTTTAGGHDDVVYGGLGICSTVQGFTHDVPRLRALRRVELRRERGRLVRRVVLRGTIQATCQRESVTEAAARMSEQVTYRFDLVFYPGAARYEPETAGGMGLVCGRAAHDWVTVAKRRTSVRKGEETCVFLLGNDVARELLRRAVRTGKTLTTVFGEELVTEAARQLVDDAGELAAELALRQRGWSLLARHAPHYFRVFRAFAWQVRIGEAVALQAVPLTALFTVSQIRSRDACVQIVADVDGSRLKLDWQLVYAPTALKQPKRDRRLTRAHTYRRVVRRFRNDPLESRYVGLRCERGGIVTVDAASPSAFSRVTTLTAG